MNSTKTREPIQTSLWWDRSTRIHPELMQRLKQDTHDQARTLDEAARKRQYLQDSVKNLR